MLYDEVMMPHEVAHQWFGDRVSWASYHEQWLLEAIANYSALMLLEPRHPADAQVMLQAYRQLLASKSKDGLAICGGGTGDTGCPALVFQVSAGYEVITYGRGTWLLHMLREMFRDASRTAENPDGSDEVFLALLRGLYDRYQGKEITNADFEREVEEVLPKSLWFENHHSLDWFFDGWVNGTVFPRVRNQGCKILHAHSQADGFGDSASDRCAGRPGDQRSGVWSGRGQQSLSGPRIRRGTGDPHHIARTPGVKRLILDPYQTVLTAP